MAVSSSVSDAGWAAQFLGVTWDSLGVGSAIFQNLRESRFKDMAIANPANSENRRSDPELCGPSGLGKERVVTMKFDLWYDNCHENGR